jgi:type II secretory pathway predicted ATPase ExeA
MTVLQDELESRLLPNQLVALAAQAAQSGDLAQACEYCAQALARNPYHEEALLWQGVVADSPSERIRLLQQLLSANPQNNRAKTLLNWTLSRQSRNEAPSMSLDIELLSPCPYLGTAEDRQARFTYPCPGNVCFAEASKRRPPREIPQDSQKEVCFKTAHLVCPTYCRGQNLAQREGVLDMAVLRDYFEFFGLDEEPFNIVPISRFLYRSPQHARALLSLRQLVDHRQGLGVVYGEVGLGKTLILRTLYEELFADARYAVALIPHASFVSDYALLQAICQAFRIVAPRRRSLRDLESAFQTFLVEQTLHAQKRVVLILDEAQEMSAAQLQQVRRLLDHQVNEQQLLQLIIAGQPYLANKIAHLPALRDRIVVQVTLSPLSPSEVKEMISMRLHVAGSQNGFFTPSAVRAITDLTHGSPRRINILCMKCLLEAFEQRRRLIDEELVMRITGGRPVLDPKSAASEGAAEKSLLARLRLLWQRE